MASIARQLQEKSNNPNNSLLARAKASVIASIIGPSPIKAHPVDVMRGALYSHPELNALLTPQIVRMIEMLVREYGVEDEEEEFEGGVCA